MNFSQILMYVPGIIMFLVGTNQTKQFILQNRKNACAEGTVKSCSHVQKKDSKERDLYNYYNVSVTYTDPKNNHIYTKNVKSPAPYQSGQSVRLYLGSNDDRISIISQENEYPMNPFFILIAGILLIFLALAENQGKEPVAMLCLAGILIAGGLSLILDFINLKNKQLEMLDSEIIDVYTRQVSKESKIIKGAKFTYYPIVSYLIDDVENYRLCNVNSSIESTFKIGEHMPLYYSHKSGTVTEKHARLGLMLLGIILLGLGIAAALSIITVL